MRTPLLWAGLCLLNFACSSFRPPDLVKIPLQSCAGLPCVDATFGGAKLKLLVSLADDMSYLTPSGMLKADSQRPAKEFGKARRFKLASVELNDLFAVDQNLNGALSQLPGNPNPAAVDGTVSYSAFGDRMLVLNIPGKYLELSAERLTRPVCSANCSQLQDSRATDMADGVTLTTDGFAAGNVPLRARLDTVFPGAVAIVDPIKGLKTQGGSPAEGRYRGSRLSYLQTAPIYFGGKPVASSAPVVRADDVFTMVGPKYDSAIGLAILSTGAYAFDLRSMKMWRYQ